MTVILYSDFNCIVKRLKKRNPADKDIERVGESEKIYSRMIDFCKKRNMPYVIIDSSGLTLDETAEKIIEKYKEIISNGK